MPLKVLDLFSGIGGFSLGLERAGMQTIAFCEIDPFCRRVLSKHWPEMPIHEDIRELDGKQYRGAADVVCGGFPCQPFSHAGKRAGADDDRHLWPEMLRVIREVQPRFVIGENVPGIISMELDNCLSDLEALGYACGTFVIPACAVDARHRRDRVWIVADRDRDRECGMPIHAEMARAPETVHPNTGRDAGRRNGSGRRPDGAQGATAYAHIEHGRAESKLGGGDAARAWGQSDRCATTHAHRAGCGEQRWSESVGTEHATAECSIGWPTEPPLCRADDGIPRRVDRLRALGNAVVPAVVEMLGRAIVSVA